LLAAGSMIAVGGSVAVSSLITDYPVFTAQAVRYAAGAALLWAFARVSHLVVGAGLALGLTGAGARARSPG
jgi:hypothetical protein